MTKGDDAQTPTTTIPKLIVHGGAWSIPTELEEAHVIGLRKALEAVYPNLLSGKYDAITAVVEAIKVLEDDPTYDAGKGSFLNMKGEVEMDASLMDGTSMKAGAVACIQNVQHPIEVAQHVLQSSEHVLLVGQGALEFAKSKGIPEIDPMELLSDREIEFLKHIRQNKHFKSVTVFDPQQDQLTVDAIHDTLDYVKQNKVQEKPCQEDFCDPIYTHHRKMGTVGCVALDLHGNIAAGTSTGGVPKKLPGRSGDSPIIGSGTFADSSVAGASATGFGESIMTVQLTANAVRWMEFKNIPDKYLNNSAHQMTQVMMTQKGCTAASESLSQGIAQEAAEASIRYLNDKVKGLGGLIMIGKEKNCFKYSVAFNTAKMAIAFVEPNVAPSGGSFTIHSMVAKNTKDELST